MGRRLATDVHVAGPGGPFDFVVLKAGTEVLAEYADQITAESAYLPESAEEETPATDDAPETPTGYAALTNDQLREELIRRDLAHSGNKAELVARLTDDDAHQDEEPDTGSSHAPAADEPDPAGEAKPES